MSHAALAAAVCLVASAACKGRQSSIHGGAKQDTGTRLPRSAADASASGVRSCLPSWPARNMPRAPAAAQGTAQLPSRSHPRCYPPGWSHRHCNPSQSHSRHLCLASPRHAPLAGANTAALGSCRPCPQLPAPSDAAPGSCAKQPGHRHCPPRFVIGGIRGKW